MSALTQNLMIHLWGKVRSRQNGECPHSVGLKLGPVPTMPYSQEHAHARTHTEQRGKQGTGWGALFAFAQKQEVCGEVWACLFVRKNTNTLKRLGNLSWTTALILTESDPPFKILPGTSTAILRHCHNMEVELMQWQSRGVGPRPCNSKTNASYLWIFHCTLNRFKGLKKNSNKNILHTKFLALSKTAMISIFQTISQILHMTCFKWLSW